MKLRDHCSDAEYSSQQSYLLKGVRNWIVVECWHILATLTVTAATLLGWVMPTTNPLLPHPASSRYCGTCVLFPLPVSPTSTSVWYFSRRYKMWFRYCNDMDEEKWCKQKQEEIPRTDMLLLVSIHQIDLPIYQSPTAFNVHGVMRNGADSYLSALCRPSTSFL